MTAWTIQRLLNWITQYFTEKKVDSPRLSAELLISSALSMSRIELYTQFDKIISKDNLDKLHELVKRAADGEPVAYLTGKTEFYSMELGITNSCLIPRPETELLVERAIDFLRGRESKQFVLDLCTGCGCIAVVIAKNLPQTQIIATDISSSALETADKNIKKYGLTDRIKLLCGDLFEPLIPQIEEAKFDLIVCNPPYVSAADYEILAKNVKDYEPKEALYGGADGLDIYRRITKQIDEFLRPDSALIVEIGYRQGQGVREILENTQIFSQIQIEKDFSNNDRIVLAKK